MADEAENSNASQKQNCIFCRIIEGQVPSKKIYEDEVCIVILDINPAHIGHSLVIPKEHYQIMPNLPEKELKHLFRVSKHISNAMLKYLGVKGTTIFVANGATAGQKAPHFMIHVIPRKQKDNLFAIPKRKVSEKDLEKVQEILVANLSKKIGRASVKLERKSKDKNKDNIVDAEVVEENNETKEISKAESNEEETQKEKNVAAEKQKPAKRNEAKKAREKKTENMNIDEIANMFLGK